MVAREKQLEDGKRELGESLNFVRVFTHISIKKTRHSWFRVIAHRVCVFGFAFLSASNFFCPSSHGPLSHLEDPLIVISLRSKTKYSTTSTTTSIPLAVFFNLHIDLVGPLPTSNSCTRLLTIIDRTTRWPEAIPLPFTAAAECALATEL